MSKKNLSVPTKKIAFDSFTDIKSEIGPLAVKSEPKWEMEIDLATTVSKPVETMEGKDIVIANTVIRKVDANAEDVDSKSCVFDNADSPDLTWTSNKPSSPSIDLDVSGAFTVHFSLNICICSS